MTERHVPNFSFIIPVYNTENWLENCVNSILAQPEVYSYEILLIDDGSTDSSYELCKAYASSYPFIHTMTKRNEGQGVARNVGVSMARGEIICFGDFDFVNFGFSFRNINGVETRRFAPSHSFILEEQEIFKNSLLIKDIYSSPCNKAYRRKFIIENNLKFPAVRANEDILFACLVARCARRTLFSTEVIYYASIRPGSTSRGITVNNFVQTERSFVIAREAFKRDLESEEIYFHFDAHTAKVLSYLIYFAAGHMSSRLEFNEASRCVDRIGLRRISGSKEALALLPIKNRLMVKFTRCRFLFWLIVRPIVRLARLTY